MFLNLGKSPLSVSHPDRTKCTKKTFSPEVLRVFKVITQLETQSCDSQRQPELIDGRS